MINLIKTIIEPLVNYLVAEKSRLDTAIAGVKADVSALEAKIVAEVEAKISAISPAVDPAVQPAIDALAPKVEGLANQAPAA